MAAIDVVHIPFKGIPEALTETMTGRRSILLLAVRQRHWTGQGGQGARDRRHRRQTHGAGSGAADGGRSGLPGYLWDFWYGLLVPSKTPRTVVARLNQEITRILSDPDLRQRWAPLGVEPTPGSSEQFDKLIADEMATFTKIARAANIK